MEVRMSVSAYGNFDEKHFYDIWTPYVTYGPPYVVFIMWKNSLLVWCSLCEQTVVEEGVLLRCNANYNRYAK